MEGPTLDFKLLNTRILDQKWTGMVDCTRDVLKFKALSLGAYAQISQKMNCEYRLSIKYAFSKLIISGRLWNLFQKQDTPELKRTSDDLKIIQEVLVFPEGCFINKILESWNEPQMISKRSKSSLTFQK